MKSDQVLILTESVDWHTQQLQGALSNLGRSVHCCSLKECYFDTSAPYGLRLPGFEEQLPLGVLVRGISKGTFEQVTLRLGILHALQEWGVLVYNSANSIERTVDKSMTTFLLKKAGIPTPDTWVSESFPRTCQQLQILASLGNKGVLKPLFGAQGRGLLRLETGKDEFDREYYQGVYYLQKFISTWQSESCTYCDWRILVVGRQAVAAMLRRHEHWVTNCAQGASCEPVNLEPACMQLAEAAAQSVGVEYGGVDIVRDQIGQYWVVEVNSIPAWRGLQSVCTIDLAAYIAQHFVNCLGEVNSR